MTTKPRIRREFSKALGRYVWVCRGDGAAGSGLRPRQAYFMWETYKRFAKTKVTV